MKRTTDRRSGERLAAVAFTAALLAMGCAEPPAEVRAIKPVKTIVVGESGRSGGRVFPGVVRASQRARLSFRVSGPLAGLPISGGKEVSKGDLLAQIDPRDFELQVEGLGAQLAALQAERAAMESARPEDIRRLEADLAAARARLLEADATFRRYQRLYENNNVSRAEFDQRRAMRDVSEADVAASTEALQIGRVGARAEDIAAMDARLRSAQAALREARDSLEDTSLRAPYDGIVAERYVENFEYVQARQEILSLQDVSTVEVVVQIPENVVALARQSEGGEFSIQFESIGDQEFPARATEIATQADPVTRTYSVVYQTPAPESADILAGMTAEVLLTHDTAVSNVFSLPVSAVFTDENGEQCVWVLDSASMTVAKKKVEVGELVGADASILAGLSRGETVVTAGAGFLSDGLQVREITDELRERR